VTRPISILSLLSGIPTAMRVSHSTDRLLWLDLHRDDKVLAKLKVMDPGGGAVASAWPRLKPTAWVRPQHYAGPGRSAVAGSTTSGY
jgi:hypothetical protein